MSTKQMDDNDDESGWTESGRSLLSRGWSVGKNVALAGAAISVAPVLVPPLLLFSVFGLALSVPFGVLYAGVVGTERLMDSLLPLGEDSQDEMMNEGEKDVEEMFGDDLLNEKRERNEDNISNIETMEPQEGRDKEESFGTDEEMSNVPVEGDLWQKTVVEAVYDIKDGNNEGAEITTKMVEIKPIKVRSELENQKGNEEAQNLGLEERKQNARDENKGTNGSSRFKSEFTSAGDGKSDGDREEQQYNKKQLWEQVRALRIVIGYKAPICKNLPDEMRALYHFTGLDLPLTASDLSSIMDLNYKLRFLKSLIGVE